MKKTKIITTTLLSTLVLGTISATTVVNAEEEVKEYNTNAAVGFEANDEPAPPVDPENPDPTEPIDPVDPIKPTDPEQPGPTPTVGPLSIDFASTLYFGNQKISTADETYFAAAQLSKNSDETFDETTNYVQITDSRGLTEGRWELRVSQPSAFISDESKQELSSAKIYFTDIALVSQEGNTSKYPVLNNDGFFLESGSTEIVATANEANQGLGTWVTRFGSKGTLVENEEGKEVEIAGKTVTVKGKYAEQTTKLSPQVRLEVPGAANKVAELYSTKIIWTLSDTPDNGEENTEGDTL
ncbi:WxL domain-containing protein [Vagococcus xieshaowenii]|uniref:WxL domain-containing protein n=1 Tax=Vagococcus xieshaowenii TaxID=2562451 RepID=A0AAJ5EDS9_9ENTE|nr:WxL domain-containing protein [Vagococcus xieshaowenii]QCA28950.1 WxL domain-containing protein [Vagococcus xieshaowenii]TFZ39238.1 WxL domain-containing protein [Vagococcus xieshaowenii]